MRYDSEFFLLSVCIGVCIDRLCDTLPCLDQSCILWQRGHDRGGMPGGVGFSVNYTAGCIHYGIGQSKFFGTDFPSHFKTRPNVKHRFEIKYFFGK